MAAIDNIVDKLRQAGCKPRRVGAYFMAHCPSHDDSTPSLKISTGAEGRVLMHCHGGCTIDSVLAAAGLAMRSLFSDVKTERQADTNTRSFPVRFRDAIKASDLPSGARLLMFILSTHCDRFGLSCFPGQRLLQAEAGMSSATVVHHLNLAELHGFIVRFERGKSAGKKNRGHDYVLLIPSKDDLPLTDLSDPLVLELLQQDRGGVVKTDPLVL